jgi:hypothetical protein
MDWNLRHYVGMSMFLFTTFLLNDDLQLELRWQQQIATTTIIQVISRY